MKENAVSQTLSVKAENSLTVKNILIGEFGFVVDKAKSIKVQQVDQSRKNQNRQLAQKRVFIVTSSSLPLQNKAAFAYSNPLLHNFVTILPHFVTIFLLFLLIFSELYHPKI